ncbi:MAG: hypothetical protein NC400_00490 [Clostridium sp.]|nr:hypothetical protein [Clostridium sp.]
MSKQSKNTDNIFKFIEKIIEEERQKEAEKKRKEDERKRKEQQEQHQKQLIEAVEREKRERN